MDEYGQRQASNANDNRINEIVFKKCPRSMRSHPRYVNTYEILLFIQQKKREQRKQVILLVLCLTQSLMLHLFTRFGW